MKATARGMAKEMVSIPSCCLQVFCAFVPVCTFLTLDRRLYDKANKAKAARAPNYSTVVNPATDSEENVGVNTRSIVSVAFLFILLMYVAHCTYVTSNAYSHPSVVLQSHTNDGLV